MKDQSLPKNSHCYIIDTPELSMSIISGPLMDDDDPRMVWVTSPNDETKLFRIQREYITEQSLEEMAQRMVDDLRIRNN
jgi:hypothetical protein